MRLLSPRERPIEPARIDLRRLLQRTTRSSAARRFARPQLRARRWPARRSSSARWRCVVRRPPRLLSAAARAAGRAAAAAAGAGLAVGALAAAAAARARSPAGAAMAVGLVTQSWRGWAVDLLKATAIEAVLAGRRGRGRRWRVTRRYPRGWWLPAAAGSVRGRRRCWRRWRRSCSTRSSTTSRRCPRARRAPTCSSWRAPPASRSGRSTRSTPAAGRPRPTPTSTGLGPTKRVVLFDTLLDRYSRDEVRVVVAHELAHVRNRDVSRGVAYAALVAPAAALAVQRLSWALSPERGTRRGAAGAGAGRGRRRRADRADRQPPVARDRAPRRRLLARADRARRRRSSRSSGRSRSRTSPTSSRRAG